MKNLLIIFFFLVITPCFSQLDSLNSYYTQGIDASKSGDSLTYYHYFDLANKVRPNHPTLLYHLANAAMKIGNEEACISALSNLVKNNVGVDFESENYSHFKGVNGFDELETLKNKLNTEINSLQIKLQSSIPDHIESMAFDQKEGAYYFGSVNTRSIWKRSKNGEESVVLSAKDYDKIYAVMGLVVDANNQFLWACTAALPQMSGYTKQMEGYSSIIKIDLKTNSVIKTYEFNSGNAFGDIKLYKGIPYVSDGSGNNIYYLEGEEFKKFLQDDNGFINLQGIDFGNDKIYASDYIRGLFEIDLKTKNIKKLNVFGDYPERGIDGVYYNNNHLYLTQNGANPMRVFDLELNSNDQSVLNVLIQNNSQLAEPTQGYVINNKFQFIANSSWANYNKDNSFKGNANGVVILGN